MFGHTCTCTNVHVYFVCHYASALSDSYAITEQKPNGKYLCLLPFHYSGEIETASTNHAPERSLRLAQEVTSLATSLPLSPSSSVFVRCDEERLDIMKVGSDLVIYSHFLLLFLSPFLSLFLFLSLPPPFLPPPSTSPFPSLRF